jgi:hypothetical protein
MITIYFRITFLFLITVIFSINANAQSKSNADTSYFKLQLDYLSNYVYNGRVDSIKSPYQTITASYHFSNGIYLNGSANYLLASGQNRFDYFQFDVGYEYKLGEKISGEVYGSKYFYNNNANLLNGNISADFGASFNYDFGLVQFNNTADLFFSNATDFQYNPGVEKSIKLGDASKPGYWSITPGVYANISSINYYESLVNRKINGAKGGAKAKNVTPLYPIITNITSVKNPGVKLMDYEFTMPITYDVNNWNLTFTSTFAMPQSPIFTSSTITTQLANGVSSAVINNSTPYSEKNLKNSFYFQFGIAYKF